MLNIVFHRPSESAESQPNTEPQVPWSLFGLWDTVGVWQQDTKWAVLADRYKFGGYG